MGKADGRIECFGVVDELNAAIGVAVVAASAGIAGKLRVVQNELFVIGSHLACEEATRAGELPAIEEASVGRLEMEIDAAMEGLKPLKNFILPGGSEAGARLHLARTVCRRAERGLVKFAQDRPVPGVILTYLNRLSDWLFVQARAANAEAGVEDVLWKS